MSTNPYHPFESLSALRAFEKEQTERRVVRVAALRAQFDGAIRYNEMLMDHPEWTDERCLEFARKWHAVAVKQYAENKERWNNSIPYCRNDVTKANLDKV